MGAQDTQPRPTGDPRPFNRDDVADMISNAMAEDKFNSRPTGLEGDLAELDEVMKQIDMYSPLVEAYAPKMIEKCGPAFRTVMAAMFKEMMPVFIPVIRKEAQVIAKEFVSEYFRQLHAYTKEQIKQLPETVEDLAKAINSIK
jgi:hypothetical protein